MKDLFLSRAQRCELPADRLIAALQTQYVDRDGKLAFSMQSDTTQSLLNLESADGAANRVRDLNTHLGGQVETLKQQFLDAGYDKKVVADFTDAQWKAGAIILGAAGNLGDYHRRAMTVETPSAKDESGRLREVSVVEYGAGSHLFDARFGSKMNMEAFDNRELAAGLSFSAVYNVTAARQNEAGELLFPTFTVTPDLAGFEIIINRPMVLNEVVFPTTGAPNNYNRVNLINAEIDYTILNQNPMQLVPVFIVGNAANNAFFATGIGASDTTISGRTVHTAPLAIGVEVNVIGVAQDAVLQASGQLNQTDSVDQAVTLNAVYLKVIDTATAPNTNYVKLTTQYLPRTTWQKTQEGFDREVLLAFQSTDLALSSLTRDVAGAVVPALTAFLTDFPNAFIKLRLNVNGTGNLQTGDFTVNANNAVIASVWTLNSDGTQTQITDTGSLATINGLFASIQVVGYDLGCFLSDINRRIRGLNIETVWESERHLIPLGPPITALNPLTGTRTGTDLSAPLTATRIRNSNLAMTKLLQVRDMLQTSLLNKDYRAARAATEGIGGKLMMAWFDTQTVDCLKLVNSLTSSQRTDDVSTAIINLIRRKVYRGYVESGYQPALDAQMGAPGTVPTVAIVTNPVVAKHLIVNGDTRLLSIGFPYKIATTYDLRLRTGGIDSIYVTFVLEGLTAPSPMSFGAMAWMPELATQLQISRGNSTVQETTVQPRVLHVLTLPFLIEILLQNLDQVVSDRISYPFETVANIDLTNETEQQAA